MNALLEVIANSIVSARVLKSEVPCRIRVNGGVASNTRDLSFDVPALETVHEVELLDCKGDVLHAIPVVPEKFSRRGKYVVAAGELVLKLTEEGE